MLANKITTNVVTALALLLFALHFLMTAVYLLPLNPIKLQYHRSVNAWMTPLFNQNWHLFGPTPVSTNLTLIGKCRSGRQESRWLDITQGLLERFYERRLSATPAMASMQLAGMTMYTSGAVEIEPSMVRFCAAEADHPACVSHRNHTDAVRTRGERILVALVSESCNHVLGDRPLDEVYLRIADVVFPRFSKRQERDQDGVVGVHDIGWRPALNAGGH